MEQNPRSPTSNQPLFDLWSPLWQESPPCRKLPPLLASPGFSLSKPYVFRDIINPPTRSQESVSRAVTILLLTKSKYQLADTLPSRFPQLASTALVAAVAAPPLPRAVFGASQLAAGSQATGIWLLQSLPPKCTLQRASLLEAGPRFSAASLPGLHPSIQREEMPSQTVDSRTCSSPSRRGLGYICAGQGSMATRQPVSKASTETSLGLVAISIPLLPPRASAREYNISRRPLPFSTGS